MLRSGGSSRQGSPPKSNLILKDKERFKRFSNHVYSHVSRFEITEQS